MLKKRLFGVEFGSFASPISSQVPKLPKDKALQFQRDADAITRLSIRRVIAESEAARARGRLFKHIAKEIKEGR